MTPDSVPVADRRPRDASTLDSVPGRLIVGLGSSFQKHFASASRGTAM